MIPVTKAVLALGFVPSLSRSSSWWEKKGAAPVVGSSFNSGLPCFSAQIKGAGFLAPVKVEQEKAESGRGRGECRSTLIHSFIHSFIQQTFLAQLPARLRVRCWR